MLLPKLAETDLTLSPAYLAVTIPVMSWPSRGVTTQGYLREPTKYIISQVSQITLSTLCHRWTNICASVTEGALRIGEVDGNRSSGSSMLMKCVLNLQYLTNKHNHFGVGVQLSKPHNW